MKIETIQIQILKPHPENYNSHPEDQISHLKESIKANGIYRNIVISSDDFILCGHGVVEAMKQLEIQEAPIIRVPFLHSDLRAKKLLIGDNEISGISSFFYFSN